MKRSKKLGLSNSFFFWDSAPLGGIKRSSSSSHSFWSCFFKNASQRDILLKVFKSRRTFLCRRRSPPVTRRSGVLNIFIPIYAHTHALTCMHVHQLCRRRSPSPPPFAGDPQMMMMASAYPRYNHTVAHQVGASFSDACVCVYVNACTCVYIYLYTYAYPDTITQ
jgi:hypothetical protein